MGFDDLAGLEIANVLWIYIWSIDEESISSSINILKL